MGFFCLADGKHVMTTRANNTRILHAHYTSTVQCVDSTTLPANICIDSPTNDIPHANNTIAFVYARTHITNDLTVLMDASEIIACPGDPNDDSYQDSILDMPNLILIALGQVSGKVSHLPDASCCFPLAISEYVWGNSHLSTIRRAPHSLPTLPYCWSSFVVPYSAAAAHVGRIRMYPFQGPLCSSSVTAFASWMA